MQSLSKTVKIDFKMLEGVCWGAGMVLGVWMFGPKFLIPATILSLRFS